MHDITSNSNIIIETKLGFIILHYRKIATTIGKEKDIVKHYLIFI